MGYAKSITLQGSAAAGGDRSELGSGQMHIKWNKDEICKHEGYARITNTGV